MIHPFLEFPFTVGAELRAVECSGVVGGAFEHYSWNNNRTSICRWFITPYPILYFIPHTMRTLSLPCLSSSLYSHTHALALTLSHRYHCRISPRSSFIFTPHRRSHFLTPCSSLRQTQRDPKKQLGAKINTAPSDSALKRLFSPNDSQGDGDAADNTDSRSDFQDATAFKGTLLAGFLLLGLVGGFASVGYIYRDQINSFLNHLSLFIEGYGPAGYALFIAVYAGLEILAIPAIPLTMSAGLLFGSVVGTIIVSISGTVAASVAFLIARYFARERILKLVEGNKKFLAIDKAIGENGFRVVTLLRLSPLLPFSLGNYLYGLTSVKFIPYVLGSWLGMLPGTWAYVSAGAFGRAIIQDESELSNIFGGNSQLLTLGLGLLATALAATYVTRLAKDAIKDIE